MTPTLSARDPDSHPLRRTVRAEDCSNVALFSQEKNGFLPQFLRLRHGIPQPRHLQPVCSGCLSRRSSTSAFGASSKGFASTAQYVIAIDGMVLRRSFDRAAQKSPQRLGSAWAAGRRLLLGQVASEEKSNEITIVPSRRA